MRLVDFFWPVVIFSVLKVLSQYQLSNYSDDLDSRYKSYAAGNDKATVVLIPGLDGATAFFSDIAPELTPYYHVVIFHLPLQSRNGSVDYSFDHINAALLEVLDELKVSEVSVVGESFGGIIAQHFALAYPHRLKGLVLLSSLAETKLPPEIQFKLNYLMPIISTFGSYFPHFAQFLFAQIHLDDVVEPSESHFVKHLFVKEASFAHFFSVLARIKLVSKLNITSQVPHIPTRTLVVHGEDDHFTKKDSLTLHALLPDSQLQSLPGGHLAHVSAPREFASLVREFVG